VSRETSQKLKHITSQLKALEVDLSEARKAHQREGQKVGSIKERIKKLSEEQKSITKSDPVVSEHATLRYLERAGYITMKEIQEQIMTNDLMVKIKAMGDGKYGIQNGLTAVVKNNTVITVVS